MAIVEKTMILKINNNNINFTFEDCSTIGGILEKVVKERFAEKEFITEISINGEVISDEKRGKIESRTVEGVSTIEIKTEKPRDLSIRIFENMGEFLDGIITSIHESADKFRLEDETEANRHFVGCVEALQVFINVIDKIKALNALDLKAITWRSSPVAEKETALLDVFNRLHDMQVNKDWVTLADLLEYELAAIISDWKEILPVLCDVIKKAPSRN
ncbi:MAG: hypothetical protein IEMM0002_0406 [bacterium]|nr:MAG: hypothetical protein IEMM0002_0406 [bacterium]